MTATKFFRSGSHSIAYDTPEEMAAFLDAHPDLAADFLEETFGVIRTMLIWGDYKTPRDVFVLALEALAIHREHTGTSVLR